MKKALAPTALFLTLICLLSSFGTRASAAVAAEYEEAAITSDVKVSSRICELLFGSGGSVCGKNCSREKRDGSGENKTALLCPGGSVFGARIKQDEVTVVNSKAAKISAGDIIVSVNGKSVKSIDEIKEILKSHTGGELSLTIRHKGELREVKITPEATDGEYKLGLGLRDSAAGIGTVTFYEPKSGFFGGLGHGICDSESGEVIKMSSGAVTDVILGGVQKGEVGKPGELCGVLTNEEHGELFANTECGVFGSLKQKGDGSKPIKIASRSEVREGEAKIISTVKNGKKAEYSIELYDVNPTSTGTKSFKIKVTDKALLAMTGGIVRGMSGSPIIQNGKLVGAVTHVMVADPTEGYGIFIENMLNAAQLPMAKAS